MVEQLENIVVKETPESFSIKVVDLVTEKNMTYLDAIKQLTEEYDYEYEFVSKMLTPVVFCKLKEETTKLHLIKKEETAFFE